MTAAEEPTTALPSSAKALLKGVAYDANAFGHGRLDLPTLTSQARRLKRIGLRAWVPEPVAWEWAEHIASDVEVLRTKTRATFRRLRLAGMFGVEPTLPTANKADTIAQFLKALHDEPEIDVIPLTGDAAVQAVKDQIQQIGAGSLKEGVKTGAADSAWLRIVLQASGGPDGVVLVTSNRRDVQAHCKAAGVQTPRMTNVDRLPSLLFTFTPAPPDMTKLLYSYLAKHAAGVGLLNQSSEVDLGPIEVGRDSLNTWGDEFTLDSIEIVSIIRIVAISDVEVETESAPFADDEGDHAVTSATVDATVLLLADVEGSGYRLDNDGRVVNDTLSLPQTLIVAPVTVIVEDGAVTSWVAAGPARGYPQFDESYSTAEEALEAAVDALTLLPDLQLPIEWPLEGEPNIELNTAVGPLNLGLSGETAFEWTITAELGSVHATIECRHDGTARVWDGPDGFDAFPPYRLSSSVPGERAVPGPHTAISVLTNAIFDPEHFA